MSAVLALFLILQLHSIAGQSISLSRADEQHLAVSFTVASNFDRDEVFKLAAT